MSKIVCDRAALEAYLLGELDEKECERLEAHALVCESCRTYLDRELAGIAQAVRVSVPEYQVPTEVHLRVREITGRNRAARMRARLAGLLRPRFALPAATVCVAAIAAFLVMHRSPVGIVLDGTQGVVLINGVRTAKGTAVASGSMVACIGQAEFRLPGVRVQSDAVRAEFRVRQIAAGWRFEPVVGDLRFVDETRHADYDVAAGGRVMRPIGTRFEVHAGDRSRLAVYSDAVSVTSGGKPETIRAGAVGDLVGGQTEVEDDPTAVLLNNIILLPLAGGRQVEAPHTSWIALPPEATGRITSFQQQAMLNPHSSLPYLQIADVLASVIEFGASADAVQQAISVDEKLADAPDELLWRLFRAHASAYSDPGVAGKLLDMLVSRHAGSTAYCSTWHRLLFPAPTGNPQQLIQCAATLMEFGHSEDSLAVSSILVSMAEDPETRWNRRGMHEARVLLRHLLDHPVPNMSVQEQALAWHILGEAQFVPGMRQESVESTWKGWTLWHLPRWGVNLASRLLETAYHGNLIPGANNLEALVYQLYSDNLPADPSFYAYSRVRAGMVELARSPKDRDGIKKLTIWMAERFSSVPEANIFAAQEMTYTDSAATERYLRRAEALYSVIRKPLPQADRNVLGVALWKQGMHAEALAAVTGIDNAHVDPSAWVFFRDTNQYETALKLLTDPSARMPESTYENPWLYDEAQLLAKLRRYGDARAAYRGVIKSETQEAVLHPDEAHSVGALINARIALAELRGTAPSESSALARAVLADLPALKGQIGLTGQTREVLYYQARAHWLLGNRSQAKREMAACIALAPPPDTTPSPADLLASWNAASP